MSRLLSLLLLATAVAAQSLTGLWDATVTVNGVVTPFRMEFAGDGDAVKGSFFNGEQKVTSTAGRFVDGTLALDFAYMDTKLAATWKDGALGGQYGRPGREYPFRARRFAPSKLTETDVPSIAGLWEVGVKSPKGESTWRLIVRQSGPEVSAAILRVDGDTGALEGTY